ncbi:MAG: hypothetical protein HQ502_18980 [Alphaproteobacteria bacterium]|nr:hypothetical protein [Alphaproteobacteria bacterium]
MASGIPVPVTGILTFDAEGQEGGRYDSRQFHVPSATSGLTIGRGYDMKLRTKSQIRDDLAAAGVVPAMSALISQAAGMAGGQADEFIAENHLEDFKIAPEAQLKLFEIEYARQAADARRLATKPDVAKAYGVTDWDALDPTIRQVVVDLRFRGDYTPTTRRFLHACVVNNDLGAFAEEIGNQENWPNVPADRFGRRKAFCDAALS